MNPDIKSITLAIGRVIVPLGERRVDNNSNLAPGQSGVYAGVAWGTLVDGEPVTGEILVPIDSAANFTAAVQCARKEAELMFQTFFPLALAERSLKVSATDSPAKDTADKTESPQAAARRRMGRKAVAESPKPEVPAAHPLEAKGPAPGLATPDSPAPEPAPVHAAPVVMPPPSVPVTEKIVPLAEPPSGEPDPDQIPGEPEPDPAEVIVNLPCKYVNMPLKEVAKIKMEAVRWFATNDQTNRPQYRALRNAATRYLELYPAKAA